MQDAKSCLLVVGAAGNAAAEAAGMDTDEVRKLLAKLGELPLV
jgi:hypothetical protein